MSVIGVWGDSIAWGAYDLEIGGWVERLKLHIEKSYGDESEVYNLGIAGDKVNDVLTRFEIEYSFRKPDTVILAAGINDSPHNSHPEGTPLNIFEENLSKLIQLIKAKTSKILVVGPSNVNEENPKSSGYKNIEIKKYSEAIRKVAEDNYLVFVDVEGLVNNENLVFDGLHPDSSGHEKIFQKVKQTLEMNSLLPNRS